VYQFTHTNSRTHKNTYLGEHDGCDLLLRQGCPPLRRLWQERGPLAVRAMEDGVNLLGHDGREEDYVHAGGQRTRANGASTRVRRKVMRAIRKR
jgi:hypothetical protein